MRETLPAPFTVFGASGFIGGALCRYLQAENHPVSAPARGALLQAGRPLGHVIYAIGLTADFRSRPLETMDAHVGILSRLLRNGNFQSFTYLSSTRIYGGAKMGREDARFTVDPANASDLYNISKLAGEAACLAIDRPDIRVARLCNVIGNDPDSENFIPSLLRDARATGRVTLGTAPGSAKDYVGINDVVRALRRIALFGNDRIYNVAAGTSVTNHAAARAVSRVTGAVCDFADNAPLIRFPPVDTQRLEALFARTSDVWAPTPFETLIETLAWPDGPGMTAIAGG